MFQTSKSSAAARVLRLPKQMALPGPGDIEFVGEQANKIVGRQIELPFSLSQDRENDFVLTVSILSPGTEPAWSLLQLRVNGEQILWQHLSTDISLIYRLVQDAVGAAGKNDVEHAAAQTQVATSIADPSQLVATQKFSGVSDILEGALINDQAVAQGNLKVTPVPALLNTINHQAMSGKLAIENKQEVCEVYFTEGKPVHCLLKEIAGDLALMELISWREGDYRFYPGQKTLAQTVNAPFDDLLKTGLTLIDQFSYLETNGFHLESCLIRKNAMISEEELRIRLSKGIPGNIEQQIDFYELVDNHSTIFELLAKRPLSKAQWIPIIFNLVSSALVQISDQVSQQSRLASLKSFGVDENELQNVAKHLIRSETGILTYPAFIYFLDQEYLRYQYFNFPFSVIIYSIGSKKGEFKPVEHLPTLAIRRAMQRISQVKRPVDMLGHFEQNDFAMLLPNTNASAAGALANRMLEVMMEAPLTSDLDARSLWLAFGVATVPEDCQEMDKLLLAVKKARDQVRQGRERVILARGVSDEQSPSAY